MHNKETRDHRIGQGPQRMRSCSPKSLLNHPRLALVLVYSTDTIYLGYTYMSVVCTQTNILYNWKRIVFFNGQQQQKWVRMVPYFWFVCLVLTQLLDGVLSYWSLLPCDYHLKLRSASLSQLTNTKLDKDFPLVYLPSISLRPSVLFCPKILIG